MRNDQLFEGGVTMQIYDKCICDDCGQAFDGCDAGEERDRDDGELYAVCPACGSSEMTEAFECDVCGQYKPDGTQSSFSDTTCGDCYCKMVDEIAEFGKEHFNSGALALFVDIIGHLREV